MVWIFVCISQWSKLLCAGNVFALVYWQVLCCCEELSGHFVRFLASSANFWIVRSHVPASYQKSPPTKCCARCWYQHNTNYHPFIVINSIALSLPLPFLTVAVSDILPHYAPKEEAEKRGWQELSPRDLRFTFALSAPADDVQALCEN